MRAISSVGAVASAPVAASPARVALRAAARGFLRGDLRRLRDASAPAPCGARSTVPPAASIFSRAVAEKRCAVTDSFFVRSPWPRIFTSVRRLLIRPSFSRAPRRDVVAGVETRSRSRTLTACVNVRNGPTGIASFDVEPRCFGRRMYIGIWPPSKPARILCEPARDFWPFMPAAGVAALARAEPAPDALAVLPRLRRLQVAERACDPRTPRPPPPARGGGPCAAYRRAPGSPASRPRCRSCRGRARAACRGAAGSGRSGCGSA